MPKLPVVVVVALLYDFGKKSVDSMIRVCYTMDMFNTNLHSK